MCTPCERSRVERGASSFIAAYTSVFVLAPRGIPPVISERLGHASIAITNDLYSHLMPGMEPAAAAKVDAALEGVISSTEIANFGK